MRARLLRTVDQRREGRPESRARASHGVARPRGAVRHVRRHGAAQTWRGQHGRILACGRLLGRLLALRLALAGAQVRDPPPESALCRRHVTDRRDGRHVELDRCQSDLERQHLPWRDVRRLKRGSFMVPAVGNGERLASGDPPGRCRSGATPRERRAAGADARSAPSREDRRDGARRVHGGLRAEPRRVRAGTRARPEGNAHLAAHERTAGRRRQDRPLDEPGREVARRVRPCRHRCARDVYAALHLPRIPLRGDHGMAWTPDGGRPDRVGRPCGRGDDRFVPLFRRRAQLAGRRGDVVDVLQLRGLSHRLLHAERAHALPDGLAGVRGRRPPVLRHVAVLRQMAGRHPRRTREP